MNNYKSTFAPPRVYMASKESTGKILSRSTFVIMHSLLWLVVWWRQDYGGARGQLQAGIWGVLEGILHKIGSSKYNELNSLSWSIPGLRNSILVPPNTKICILWGKKKTELEKMFY